MVKWTIESRKLSELKEYDKNPRRITEKGLGDLIKSLELFGLAEPIVINRDDIIIGGHARVQALKRVKGKNAKIDVYVPDMLLDEKQVQKPCIRLNKNVAGTSDFDMLTNEDDARDLVAWGFSEDELGFGEPDEDEEENSGGDGDGDAHEEDDDARNIKCPKCNHDFSILTEKTSKKKKKK